MQVWCGNEAQHPPIFELEGVVLLVDKQKRRLDAIIFNKLGSTPMGDNRGCYAFTL